MSHLVCLSKYSIGSLNYLVKVYSVEQTMDWEREEGKPGHDFYIEYHAPGQRKRVRIDGLKSLEEAKAAASSRFGELTWECPDFSSN